MCKAIDNFCAIYEIQYWTSSKHNALIIEDLTLCTQLLHFSGFCILTAARHTVSLFHMHIITLKFVTCTNRN